MIDVKEILYEICEDDSVYDDNCDLMTSGLLDSFAMIQLFAELEDNGIEIHPTKIDIKRLSTPASISQLVEEYV